MRTGSRRAIVIFSAEPARVMDAIRFAQSEDPRVEIIVIAPTLQRVPVDENLFDQLVVVPGPLLHAGPVRKVLARDLRIGKGDRVIVPLDVFQVDSHKKLQAAILVSARGASALLFGDSNVTLPVRWHNLRIHEYPRQLLLACLLLVAGTILVAWEWCRYRVRATGVSRRKRREAPETPRPPDSSS